jgi:LmbE family N-acetylglucosaminyl deacetylase
MKINDIKKLVVFAAHPDDETIGCGGLIKKLTETGADVVVVFATSGNTGIDQTKRFKGNITLKRIKEAKRAAKILGIKKIIEWKYGSQQLKYNIKILHQAIKTIRIEKPDLIITHSNHDRHNDHAALYKIITQANLKAGENILPDLGKRHQVDDLWSFEIVDVFQKPDFIVDITEQMKFKLDAIKEYDSQSGIISGIRNYIYGVSIIRGFEIGKKHAEAFKNISLLPKKVL